MCVNMLHKPFIIYVNSLIIYHCNYDDKHNNCHVMSEFRICLLIHFYLLERIIKNNYFEI